MSIGNVYSQWRSWEPPHRAEHAVGVDAYLVASFRFYAGVLYTPIYPCGAIVSFERGLLEVSTAYQ